MSQDAQQATDREPDGDLSLSALTQAFAEVMGGRKAGDDSDEGPGEPPPESVAEDDDAEDATVATIEPEGPADAACPVTPRSILEAMLFVGNQEGQGLSAQQAADLMRGVEPDEIHRLVEQLNRQYAENGCPYSITSDGGRYRMALRREFHAERNRFYGRVREARLSQAAVDVLAIVAYRQPLTSEDIARLRGKPSSPVLSQLVRRGLLRIERRKERRRTPYYFTTDRFLELFGLGHLEDLPQSEELER